MTRFTQDHFHVEDHDTVWEIMYSYINPEVSEAYPERNISWRVPKNFPVWKQKENCEKECERRNKKIADDDTLLSSVKN